MTLLGGSQQCAFEEKELHPSTGHEEMVMIVGDCVNLNFGWVSGTSNCIFCFHFSLIAPLFSVVHICSNLSISIFIQLTTVLLYLAVILNSLVDKTSRNQSALFSTYLIKVWKKTIKICLSVLSKRFQLLPKFSKTYAKNTLKTIE